MFGADWAGSSPTHYSIHDGLNGGSASLSYSQLRKYVVLIMYSRRDIYSTPTIVFILPNQFLR